MCEARLIVYYTIILQAGIELKTMLKKFGFKKSEPRESEARIKLQKELFAYNKVRLPFS